MRAVVYNKYGSPDVLKLVDIEKPVPQKNEVLVRVFASTVNRTDCAMLRAKPFIMRFFTGLLAPRKPVLGTEFSGQIEAAGDDVNLFAVGDNVFGFHDGGVSSYAEYLTLAADKPIAKLPDKLTLDDATASIEGAHYAYNVIKKITLRPGQKVLVNGATGAIGSAAVQILKYYEVIVVAVCNTRNVGLVKSLGADRVIDYQREDFTKDAEQFDFVFDAVGKSTFGKCKPVIKKGGVYVSSELGPMAENVFYSLVTPLFGSRKVKFPIPVDTPGSIAFIKKLLQQGHYRPVIDRKYPLEQIVEAFNYVETGEKTGNVVVSLRAEREAIGEQ